jgi:hypothetical protein
METDHIEVDVDVAEMTEDVAGIVKLNANRVQELLDDYGDDKPQFPILKIRAGISGNGNNWSEAVLNDVAEQINLDEKPGYWGHINPAERGYAFPDPETLWLGAKVKKENGQSVLYVKGYNIPGGRARRHRSLAKVTSWAGKCSGPVVGGVRQIQKFALESIDWARPGTQGMSAGVVALATEMEEGDKVEVDWGTVTLTDLEKHNPSLFTLMKQKVEADHADSVTEMEADAEKGKQAETVFSRLRQVLGIDDKTDIIEAVTEVQERVDNINQLEIKDKLLAVLTGKLKNPKARATVLRLIPVQEMEGKTDDEIETLVTEMFTNDEDIKAVVTEMEQSPAPLTQGRRERGTSKIGGSGMVRETTTKL